MSSARLCLGVGYCCTSVVWQWADWALGQPCGVRCLAFFFFLLDSVRRSIMLQPWQTEQRLRQRLSHLLGLLQRLLVRETRPGPRLFPLLARFCEQKADGLSTSEKAGWVVQLETRRRTRLGSLGRHGGDESEGKKEEESEERVWLEKSRETVVGAMMERVDHCKYGNEMVKWCKSVTEKQCSEKC